jgi:S1-C subfamily serine protease
VPVAERPDDPGRLADLVEPEDNLVPGLGILGVNVDERIAAFLPWKRQDGGVLVAARSGDTPTGDEGTLQSGDLIQAVNGTGVLSLEALQSALAIRKPGDPIVLQVNRRGRLMYLSFETE